MNKLIAALISGLFVVGASAQTVAPAAAPAKAATPAAAPAPAPAVDPTPLIKKGSGVTNKNLKVVLEAYDKKYANNYWRSEDDLNIEVLIVKNNPQIFKIIGSQVPKGYSFIEVTCAKVVVASIVHTLPKPVKTLQLFSQNWSGQIDTETEKGKPRFLINSAECDISAPGMQ